MTINRSHIYFGLSILLSVVTLVGFAVLVNNGGAEIHDIASVIAERAKNPEKGLSQYFHYNPEELVLDDLQLDDSWQEVVFYTGHQTYGQIFIPPTLISAKVIGEDVRIHNPAMDSNFDILVGSLSPGCPDGLEPELLPSHQAFSAILAKKKTYGMNSWAIDDHDVQRIRTPHTIGMMIVYKSSTGSKVYHYCLFEIDHQWYVDFSAGHQLDKTEQTILSSFRSIERPEDE